MSSEIVYTSKQVNEILKIHRGYIDLEKYLIVPSPKKKRSNPLLSSLVAIGYSPLEKLEEAESLLERMEQFSDIFKEEIAFLKRQIEANKK